MRDTDREGRRERKKNKKGEERKRKAGKRREKRERYEQFKKLGGICSIQRRSCRFLLPVALFPIKCAQIRITFIIRAIHCNTIPGKATSLNGNRIPTSKFIVRIKFIRTTKGEEGTSKYSKMALNILSKFDRTDNLLDQIFRNSYTVKLMVPVSRETIQIEKNVGTDSSKEIKNTTATESNTATHNISINIYSENTYIECGFCRRRNSLLNITCSEEENITRNGSVLLV